MRVMERIAIAVISRGGIGSAELTDVGSEGSFIGIGRGGGRGLGKTGDLNQMVMRSPREFVDLVLVAHKSQTGPTATANWYGSVVLRQQSRLIVLGG